MKKAIIFDMDGLMIDSERVTYEEYCHKLDQLGYKFDETLYRRCLGKNKKGVYQVFALKRYVCIALRTGLFKKTMHSSLGRN